MTASTRTSATALPGLNLLGAAIILWNTRYLSRAIAALRIAAQIARLPELLGTAPKGIPD